MDQPLGCCCHKKKNISKKNNNLIRKYNRYSKYSGKFNNKKYNKIIKETYKDQLKEWEKEMKNLNKFSSIPIKPFSTYPIRNIVNLGCLNSFNIISDIVPVNIKTEAYNKHNISTPFQSTVYLTSNTNMYNISALANGYGSISLSSEGLLWTLWPLVNKQNQYSNKLSATYFDKMEFGTALSSNYSIGQMGFFFNDRNLGCTPITESVTFTNNILNNASNPENGPGLISDSPGIGAGAQGFEASLINMVTSTQNISLVVIKVTEEIARVFNPSGSISSNNQFIYLGYDGWSVLNITSNPYGPMIGSTYISPQTITGNITKNNFQVFFPPNFPSIVYYKNIEYSPPISGNNYLE